MRIISKINIHNAISVMTTNYPSVAYTLSASVALLPPLGVSGTGRSKVTEE